jgi:hypothetical protein
VAAPEAGSLWLPAGAATNFSRRLIASPGVKRRASPTRHSTVATLVAVSQLLFARHGDPVTYLFYHSQWELPRPFPHR